jgi:hypothetical protein
MDQLVPFQRSANAGAVEPRNCWPTAKQLVVLAHETPFRTLMAMPVGLGLVTMDQVLPFHCSTSVFPSDEESAYLPTAKQLVVVRHDTPFSTLSVAPTGLGLGTTDQRVPFQRSISVFAAVPSRS